MIHRRRVNTNLIAGCIITGLTVFIILVGYFWTPFDPAGMDASAINAAPGLPHLLGTDRFGRDTLSRIMQGAGATLRIAFFAVCIGAFAGTLIGGLTGYFGGILDELIMRLSDAVTAFPSVLLALVAVSIVGRGSDKLILVLGVLFIPSFARVVRGEFVKQQHRDYVKNARLMGVKDARIIFVHILPNISAVLLSSIAIGFNNAVLAEASMSFLGLGVAPTESASLGIMLKEAENSLMSAPWQALSAGFSIAILILGFSLISEGLGFNGIRSRTSKRRLRLNAENA
ncbi:MAG: ABC transporter permease [Oscillospiraceae bacterium]|jgi:peptide/nickel transport system permease protein|nr:ABC transporter permease [Oscillospiraceae bacterium]